MAEKVSGRKINVIESPQRKGDPDRLIEDSRLILQKLG
jgi:UDP-glucose 4-epimerase